MNENASQPESVTASCPSGHHVRGGKELLGRMVRCPKCATEFLFEVPTKPPISDSGVMAILGDVPPLPPPPNKRPTTRPCPQCQKLIPESSHVCPHCSFYVAKLPGFFPSS
ncbi:hypothetical protein CA13_34210 [Planctomycetes bacterium CA13]|uniref:Double zinc ribbon n=1 Tax=Novipirellula herctigrandis TaxID=2527986 RepID=A0A5C5Z4K9_9BACT|nr:hypothetical protein CA13_34210 [Planctomycetes bacterium CA13]